MGGLKWFHMILIGVVETIRGWRCERLQIVLVLCKHVSLSYSFKNYVHYFNFSRINKRGWNKGGAGKLYKD